jgi:serine/threonine protein phosphatase PrpC
LGHTHDHSLLQLMIDKGLAEADCALGEMRNRLYMRLGGETPPEPDFNETEAQDGDMFLLCSDGFWQAMLPNEMIAALAHVPPGQDGPQCLVDLARQRGGNGCDNISLSVVQWIGAAEKKPCYGFMDRFRRGFRLK